MMANGVVEVFGLDDLVEKARKELLPFLRE